MGLFDRFRQYLENEVPVTVATVVAGPEGVGKKLLVRLDGSLDGDLGPDDLRASVAEQAVRLLHEERAATQSFELPSGTFDVFFDVFPSPPQIIIVGASHAAAPLTTFAKTLGYRVVVADARAAFAQPERFPDADEVIKGWPQDVFPGLRLTESTYIVLLSHDPKFDQPTLEQVLPSRVRYIGAIGSRRTQQQRFERLRQEGYSEAQLERIHGPVGMDIGARTAEETALAIMAEITAVRHGKRGGFLYESIRPSS